MSNFQHQFLFAAALSLLAGCDSSSEKDVAKNVATDPVIAGMEARARQSHIARAKECGLNISFGKNGEIVFDPPATKAQDECFSGDWVTPGLD